MPDIVQNVIVDFQVDYSQLTTAQEQLSKGGKVDATQFKAVQDAINTTSQDTKGLIKTFKDVANASIKAGKSVEDAFGAGIQDALDEAGVSMEEFSGALKKANVPAISLRQELLKLTDAIAKAKVNGTATGHVFEEMQKRAGELSTALRSAQKETKAFGTGSEAIEHVAQSVATLAAGFEAAQGAISLFGDENEDLHKALLKVNSVMALSHGLEQITIALSKEGAITRLAETVATKAQSAATEIYTFVTGGATTATKIFRAALVATGIGALVVLLVSAYQAISSFGDSTKKTAEELERFSESIDASKESLDRFIDSQNNSNNIAIEKAKQRGATDAEVNKMIIEGLRNTAKETDKIAKGSLGKLNDFAREVGKSIGKNIGANEFEDFSRGGTTAYNILVRIRDLKISGEFDKLSKAAKESVTNLETSANKINDLVVASDKLLADAELKEQQFITKQNDERLKKLEDLNKRKLAALKKAQEEAKRQENQTAKDSIQLAIDKVNKELEQEYIKYTNINEADAQSYDDKKKNAEDWDKLWKEFQQSLTKSSIDESAKRKATLKKEQDERIKLAGQIVEVASRVASFYAQLGQLQTDRDAAEIAGRRKNVEDQLKAGVITTKAAEQRQKQIDVIERKAKQKAAEREKQAAVFTALLNIPKSILQGLSSGGPVLAAIYGALAAAEAALVIARPVPKFFKGKKDAYAGPGIVADQGAELVDRGGRMFLYTKPTQTYLGAKDKVYTNFETRQMMHNSSLDTRIHEAQNERFDYGKFAAAIPGSALNINIDKDGITEWTTSRLSRTTYMDKRYRR